jgi:hypothetical protein
LGQESVEKTKQDQRGNNMVREEKRGGEREGKERFER